MQRVWTSLFSQFTKRKVNKTEPKSNANSNLVYIKQ